MKVIMEKQLETWWGIGDLLESMPTSATQAEREAAIVELLMEDISALLNGVTFRFEP